MFRLNFTTQVMGAEGAKRLRGKKVTQTLRSPHSDIVEELLMAGRLKIGDQIEVALDNEPIGLAQISYCDRMPWTKMTIEDAERGGFDTVPQLESVLKRAGYRFQKLEQYAFYRVIFAWQK